jgi:photosystem II stability/assembly factor-like uncharacterized protein
MQKTAPRLRALAMGLVAAAVLTACGGGGSDTPPPPPTPAVTAIPDNLAITAPTTADSATAVKFGNSTGALAGLKYQWDFGDGGSSTEAAPTYSYAGGGEFEVVLKVTNEAGTSKETRTKLSITNIANVRGLECTGASSAGWCWQNPRPTGNRVNAVFFLNATTGWRAGDSGEIFKTSDGGQTWVRQNSDINAAIYGIRFLDANTGWATGAYGAMLRTTDGGSTWSVAKFGDLTYSYDLNAITAIDAKTVYVGRPTYGNGAYGTFYASRDGGVTWRALTTTPSFITPAGKFWSLQNNSVRVSTDGGLNYAASLDIKQPSGSSYFDTSSMAVRDDLRAAVHARASSYDFTANRYNYFESVNVTVDGGATWSKAESQTSGTSSGVQRLLSVSADGKTLIAVGGETGMLRSADGGVTWAPLASPATDYYSVNYVPLGGSEIVASSYSGLWLSEDGGQSWMKLSNPLGQGSYNFSGTGIRRVDATTLSATDGMGATYLSKDKGQTWSRVVAALDNGYYSQPGVLAFSDGKNGFMVEPSGRASTTKDGGATWQLKSSDFGAARAVQFINKTTGWLVSGDGRLYKSTDAGQTWLTAPVAAGAYYTNVYFANENLGWSQRSSGGAQAAYTKDGGKTWTELALPSGVASLRFGEQAWVAVGYSGVYVSTDSGATWNAMYTGTASQLFAVAFSDAKTVWAVGTDGTLLKSEDSGAKWTVVKLPSANAALRDIRFANAKVGWIVGDGGTILATQDGGKTWRQQASGTSLPLFTIQAVDSNTAWITGMNGLVLATGTGGN